MEINYKRKYYKAMSVLWILLIIMSVFCWKIDSKLHQLNADIEDMIQKEQVEIYIEAGWMPPYSLINKEDLDKG